MLYSLAVYYCYRFFVESSGSDSRTNSPSAGKYMMLNDQSTQNESKNNGSINSMNDRENNAGINNNFKAFSGKGSTLDS